MKSWNCLVFLIFLLGNAGWTQVGYLDTDFGAQGMVITPIGSDAEAYAAALQADGKIVVAGTSTEGHFTLTRYQADGSLDDGFGVNGISTTNVGKAGRAYALAIQPDGKIVVAGFSTGIAGDDFALARYLPDGSLDPDFGTNGMQTTNLNFYDGANSIVIQPDGKIMIAGTTLIETKQVFALTRYHSNGQLDMEFGVGGKVTTQTSTWGDGANALALQADGKIVVGGFSFSGFDYDFALARYHTDGSLDADFGTDGILSTDFGGSEDAIYSIALQSDGKIVAAGFSDDGSGDDFALARYQADGSLDESFHAGGLLTTSMGNQ